jgi:hypothetical protein
VSWSAKIGASVVTLAANLDIVRWVFQTYIDEAGKHERKLRFGDGFKVNGNNAALKAELYNVLGEAVLPANVPTAA